MKLIPVNEINSDLLTELGCESNKINVSFEKESGEMAYLECATFVESRIEDAALSLSPLAVFAVYLLVAIYGAIFFSFARRIFRRLVWLYTSRKFMESLMSALDNADPEVLKRVSDCLQRANLSGADLSGADLSGAPFKNPDINDRPSKN